MGIFDNDIALDLRDGFTAALAEGLLVGDATEWLQTQYAEAWDDHDDGPHLRLALAVLQLEHGTVQSRVRADALTMLAQGHPNEWLPVSADNLAERQRIVDDMRDRLIPR